MKREMEKQLEEKMKRRGKERIEYNSNWDRKQWISNPISDQKKAELTRRFREVNDAKRAREKADNEAKILLDRRENKEIL